MRFRRISNSSTLPSQNTHGYCAHQRTHDAGWFRGAGRGLRIGKIEAIGREYDGIRDWVSGTVQHGCRPHDSGVQQIGLHEANGGRQSRVYVYVQINELIELENLSHANLP